MQKIETISRLDLKAFGLSDYLIRQLTQGLPFHWEKRRKLYDISEILGAIDQKLSKPRTRVKTRKVLENLRLNLKGQSNIIKVDFPNYLSPEEEVKIFQQEVANFNQHRQQVLNKTDRILAKAKHAIAHI
jgi:hypothetical protein